MGTGIESSVLELFDGLTKALGIEAKAQHGPAKPGEQRRSVIDPGKLRRELLLPAPLPLAEGFARTARFFSEKHRHNA